MSIWPGRRQSRVGKTHATAPATSVNSSPPLETAGIDAGTEPGPDLVDVRDLIARYTVEELVAAADDYYRENLGATEYWLSKPTAGVEDAVELLTGFAQVLAGVRPLPGMRVLDFGAGTGWTSRLLTQLGCEVIVCDVSATALDVARQLFKRNPVAGAQPEPAFLKFDGRRIDLPDASVDRIVCIDAFHHVPNPREVLGEFGRILRSGGLAGFQEPGPNHSKDPQSQFEMRNYTVIENDIRMGDIAGWADEAGFSDIKLAVFTPHPFHTSIEQFTDYLDHGATTERFYEHQRVFVATHRVFFLSKAGDAVLDSRGRRGLDAVVGVSTTNASSPPGGTVDMHVTARNSGAADWLVESVPSAGRVNLGALLYDRDRKLMERDYARFSLPATSTDGTVRPGEEIALDIELAAPLVPGEYIVEIDLVAEGVTWFSAMGCEPAEIRLTVSPS
jgi:SAM-dependent methyltransferase